MTEHGIKADYKHDYSESGKYQPRHLATFAERGNANGVIAVQDPFWVVCGPSGDATTDGFVKIGIADGTGSWPDIGSAAYIKLENGKVTSRGDLDHGAFYADMAQISVPANPAAGTRRLFVDSATGKLSVRTNAGATVSLEESGAGGGTVGGTGTAGTVTKWAAGGADIEDSIITESGTAITVGGSLTVNTIVAGVADYDKFLVSHAGLIKYRTGAQVLSDIGGAATTHGASSHSGDVLPAANQELGAFHLDIGEITVPSNPAANVRRIFVNSATNELSVRTDAGSTVSLESAGGGPGSGTQWKLPVWATTTTLGDSMVSQDSGGTALTISGSVTANTIVAGVADYNKFLVSDAGLIKFRTGDEAYVDMNGYTSGDFTTDFAAESLANLTTRNHASLSDAPPSAHHTKTTTIGDLTDHNKVNHDSLGLSHDSLSDVSPSDHHGRYANSEAVNAVIGQNPLSLTNALSIGSIVAGTADYDKFLVSHTGLVKFRTGAQVLSDIGAAADPHGASAHSGDIIPASDQDFGGYNIADVGRIDCDSIRKAGFTTGVNHVRFDGTTNSDHFLRFRTGGSTTIGLAGACFSTMSASHWFTYADRTLAGSKYPLKIAFCSTNSETPDPDTDSTDIMTIEADGDVIFHGGRILISDGTDGEIWIGGTSNTNPRIWGKYDTGFQFYTNNVLGLSIDNSQNATLAGAMTISTVNAGTADYDKFLVSHTGLVKYRTGAQVLSDIGAAASSHSHTHASTTGKTANDHHNESHTIASHSDTTTTGTELETLTDGSNADSLHVHTIASHDLTGASHTENATGGAGNFLKADSGTTFSWQVHGLGASDVGAYTTAQTDAEISSEIGSHAGLPNVHHAQSHTIASHSDTTATGAELETLTNGSNADSLHVHSSSGVTGTGTANKVAKWTNTTVLGDSNITDNGTTVSVSGAFSAGAAGFDIDASGNITDCGTIAATTVNCSSLVSTGHIHTGDNDYLYLRGATYNTYIYNPGDRIKMVVHDYLEVKPDNDDYGIIVRDSGSDSYYVNIKNVNGAAYFGDTTNTVGNMLKIDGTTVTVPGTLYSGAINANGHIAPTTTDTRYLGSTSKEWNRLYIGNTGGIYFGTGSDVRVYWSSANVLGIADDCRCRDMTPLSNNVQTLGSSSSMKWNTIYVSNVNTADIDLANGFVIREVRNPSWDGDPDASNKEMWAHSKEDGATPGIEFYNNRNEMIALLDEDGDFHVRGKVHECSDIFN